MTLAAKRCLAGALTGLTYYTITYRGKIWQAPFFQKTSFRQPDKPGLHLSEFYRQNIFTTSLMSDIYWF
jgi:hypothetical protein